MIEYATKFRPAAGIGALVQHEIDEIRAVKPTQAGLRAIEKFILSGGDPEAVAELRYQAKLARQRKRSPLELKRAILRKKAELLAK